ncbi:MAG: phosphoenolpyruvate carboxylase [Myxococcota bacterium]
MKRQLDVAFPAKDIPLRQDVGLLGRLLGEVLQERGGDALFHAVENARHAARDRRKGDRSGEARLLEILTGLEPAFASEVVRAFSTYFELVNMAERVHRIRRRRAYMRADAWPQPGSLNAVVSQVVQRGATAADVAKALEDMVLSPVFTAHPTEATRRTLLVKEQRIARSMVERIEPGRLLPREEELELAKIKNEIDLAWQTEEHAHARPTVADEVEHVVFYLSEVIYRIVPAFFDELSIALDTHFGGKVASAMPRPKLRFGSWVGGDMDGNPNVGAHTIRASLRRHRELALARYRSDMRNLLDHLSQSSSRISVSDALTDRIREYYTRMPELEEEIPGRYLDMTYRVFLWQIGTRLDQTLSGGPDAYENADAFRADLELIAADLAADTGDGGLDLVERLLRRVETFGFHLATLDVRQDSEEHRRVLGELLDADFLGGGAALRLERLEQELNGDIDVIAQAPSEKAEAALDVFRAIGEGLDHYGSDAFGPYIVSMTQGADDALAVVYLARAAGLVRDGGVPLDVAPLLETVPDLENGEATIAALLSNPTYRSHVRQRGDQQMVMLGYSDSNKESGIASSRWALQRAQTVLLEVAAKYGVRLVFFHGRGGSVSRGGSKPRNAILAEPPGAVNGRLRVTEQGEIIHAKFGLRDIALRTLELNAGAVLECGTRPGNHPPKEFAAAMDGLASSSRAAYRALVVEHPDFFTYFREATPIDVIERLRIGSRPASRRAKTGIENLRAIPWVFSWTQSRHLITGWYGFGSGLRALIDEAGLEFAQRLAREWRFFDTLLADVEMVLAKADMGVAELYAGLSPDAGEVIFPLVLAEFERTRDAVCAIRGTDELLARDRVLQRAIRLRNPYADPMTIVQLDLLARWRAGGREDQALEDALIATVQGIARGMRNTG